MAAPEDNFVWIKTEGTPAGMRMYFGDPAFILAVTPAYVARKTTKTLPLNISEVQRYCEDHKQELKQVALGFKREGLTSKELT
jgi:hypothetical protein